MDLRERVARLVEAGTGKAEAARRLGVSRRSVYRYLEAQERGSLEPKRSWGSWKKLDPGKLRVYVAEHPDATLVQMGAFFGVCHQAVWRSLRAMGFTEKKKRHATGKPTRCRDGSSSATSKGSPAAGRATGWTSAVSPTDSTRSGAGRPGGRGTCRSSAARRASARA